MTRQLLVPLAAAVGAAAGGALALVAGHSGAAAAVTATFCAVLAGVSVIDLRERRIPNAWVLPATAGAIGVASLGGADRAAASLLGLAVGVVPMGVYWLIGRGRLGMGDVKLSGLVGAVLGPAVTPIFLLAGTGIGAVAALGVVLMGGSRSTAFAYGPALALGAAGTVLLYGPLVS